MKDNYTEQQIDGILGVAFKYGITPDRVRHLLNCLYEANFDEDLKSIEEHIQETLDYQLEKYSLNTA